MLLLKNKKLIILAAFFVASSYFSVFHLQGVSAQAGCGDQMGPPAPGTICPDGSVPLPDSSLPIGCPGSAQQGPVNPNSTVNCPARPGRDACEARNGACINDSGQNITQGNPQTTNSMGEPEYVPNDCNEGSGNNSENCGIIRYLVIFINVLSVLAGIVIAGSIAYGGIEYSMSGSDPQKVSAAKDRIRNAIIALVFFIFGYAILNYLVPGGIL